MVTLHRHLAAGQKAAWSDFLGDRKGTQVSIGLLAPLANAAQPHTCAPLTSQATLGIPKKCRLRNV